ncbi:MAG: glycosyltransferase family 4 protein [Nitrospiraceae bacterium]|nr:glycosyltransferase family 4 protein [Nitrospiraceae bacterium]
MRAEKAHLALFFTDGMSLAEWDRLGMLERETALYLEMKKHISGITFVTYGAADMSYSPRLPGIGILCNRWGLPREMYKKLIPFLHAKALRAADVYKSNQMKGADAALYSARFHGKKFIARCGYLWSDFISMGAEKSSIHKVRRMERRVFEQADRIVLTTPMAKREIEDGYGVDPGKIHVIPNYVRTDVFLPMPEVRGETGICFAGRLAPQKNPLALVDALEGLGMGLLVIGQGDLQGEMARRAHKKKVNIRFRGSIRHPELCQYLNSASVFVLPSHYEGHPKTLIEAMSCGLPVIGADSPGIREVIRHGDTGWLCGTDAASIREAIQHLMADSGLRERLGKNARRFAVENLSLEQILNKELAVVEGLLKGD